MKATKEKVINYTVLYEEADGWMQSTGIGGVVSAEMFQHHLDVWSQVWQGIYIQVWSGGVCIASVGRPKI